MSALDFLAGVSDWIVQVSEAHPWVAPLAVLAGGVLSVASPCSMASLPLMMGYIVSRGEKSWKKNLLMSLAFVVGLSLVFTGIGIVGVAVKSATVRLFMTTKLVVYGSYVVGVILVIVGAWLTGIINIPLPVPNLAGFKHGGLVGAFLLGIAYAFTTGPCSGPILIGVITLVKGDLVYQALLVFIYSIGAGVTVMIAGLFAGLLENVASSERFLKANLVFKAIGGLIFVAVGLYFLLSYHTLAGMILAVLSVVSVALLVIVPKIIRKDTDTAPKA